MELTPSRRAHGAQRTLSATTLVLEALVVLFAALVAHQLVPESRTVVWTVSLVTAVLLIGTSGMLRRGPAGYVIGAVLQLPVILLGIVVPAMWLLGAGFAALYVVGVIGGHRLDAEKDAVDRRVLAERAAQEAEEGSDAQGAPRTSG